MAEQAVANPPFVHAPKPMDPARLFIWLFIASEATFFAFLIVGYLYFHAYGPQGGPTAKSSLDPVKTGIFSIFLLSSSLTFWLGERALRVGDVGGLRMWLGVTAVFGGIFLGGQLNEYWGLIVNNVTIGSNVFASSFFTLTGLHGLHVFMGLLCIITLWYLSMRNAFVPPESIGLEAVGLYWHFVDAVWVLLFCLIYLGAYFG